MKPYVGLIRVMLIAFPTLLTCSCFKQREDDLPAVRPDTTKLPNRYPLSVTPDQIVIGELSAGETTRRTVEVFNPSARPYTLEKVTSSCPCVNVEGVPATIEPKSSIKLEIGIATAEEPDFRGSLAVELLGQTQNETILFRVEARFSVIDASTRVDAASIRSGR